MENTTTMTREEKQQTAATLAKLPHEVQAALLAGITLGQQLAQQAKQSA